MLPPTRLAFWPSHSSPVSLEEKLRSALGAGLAIFLTGFISSQFIAGGGLKTLMASMGASAVILFAVPNSPMARSWPLIGGHVISGLIGILCVRWMPPTWPAAALAVGLSIFAMHLLRCLHPPGGASALIPVLGGESIQSLGFLFLLTPLALNVTVMFACAQFNQQLGRKAVKPTIPRPGASDAPPGKRLGILTEDLQAALKDMNAFVDVSEDELSRLYQLAANRAFQREFGVLDCARIMSCDLVTVEFGDSLEHTWSLMQQEHVKAIPVIDRARHVIGIITMTDFFRHARAERHDGLGEKLRKLVRTTPEVNSSKPEVAGQIMTYPVITAPEHLPIRDLSPFLSERGIHQIPIVDTHNKLAGLVTQSDLIAALYRISPTELTPTATQGQSRHD